MGNILQNDVLRLSLLLFLVSSFFMIIIKDIRKLFSRNKKKAIVYIILVLIAFSLTGLLSSTKVLNNTAINSFIAFQIIFLLLGIVHVWGMRTFFRSLSEEVSNISNELFFSIGIAVIGLIAFFKVVNSFRAEFSYIFISAIIPFLLPMLIFKLYELAMSIPVKVYKQWVYPIDENIKDPTANELKNPIVISFEFKKKSDEIDEVTNFRVKAPENLEFGKLFYFFLNDYNERHPEEKIEYLDVENSPFKWIFYRKPSFLRSVKYLDFHKTVNSNSLREDDVIICQRS